MASSNNKMYNKYNKIEDLEVNRWLPTIDSWLPTIDSWMYGLFLLCDVIVKRIVAGQSCIDVCWVERLLTV